MDAGDGFRLLSAASRFYLARTSVFFGYRYGKLIKASRRTHPTICVTIQMAVEGPADRTFA